MRYVFTDESHLEDSFEDGALKEFDDRRQSAGWMGASVHATTAADSGREVDILYYQGRQNEWHWRCISCKKEFWPLWRSVTSSSANVVKLYGRQIFHWKEDGTMDEKLDSIRAECPHCGTVYCDTPNDRARLAQGGCYVPGKIRTPHAASIRLDGPCSPRRGSNGARPSQSIWTP